MESSQGTNSAFDSPSFNDSAFVQMPFNNNLDFNDEIIESSSEDELNDDELAPLNDGRGRVNIRGGRGGFIRRMVGRVANIKNGNYLMYLFNYFR